MKSSVPRDPGSRTAEASHLIPSRALQCAGIHHETTRPPYATISLAMRYHIWTEGCQMNEADSQKLAAGLAKLGWEEAARPDEADLAVVNTCVVRQKAEDRAVGYLGHLRRLKQRRNGDFRIAVIGCLVGPRTDDLRARFPCVDVWAQPQKF